MKKLFTFLCCCIFLIQSSICQNRINCSESLGPDEIAKNIASQLSDMYGIVIYEHFGQDIGYFYEARNMCPRLPIDDRPLPPGFDAFAGSFYTCDGTFICNYGVDRPVSCIPSSSGVNIDISKSTQRSFVFSSACSYDGSIISICEGESVALDEDKSRPSYPFLTGLPTDPECSFTEATVTIRKGNPESLQGTIATPKEASIYAYRYESADPSCGPVEFIYTVEVNAGCGENSADQPALFSKYEWLSNLVNYADCDDSSVDEYDLNGNTFIFVRIGQDYTLYDAEGLLYCKDSPSFSCLRNYGLTNVTDSWFCINEESNVFAEICAGDPLPNLQAPYPKGPFAASPCGPAGPVGSPPPVCDCTYIAAVNIEPKEGVTSDLIDDQFFSVNPERTTTYTITSTSGVSAPDAPCRSQSFTSTFTIIVNPTSECNSNPGCACDDVYDPVCGSDGLTYSNSCQAGCAGVDILGQGECMSNNTLPAYFENYPILNKSIDPNDCAGTSLQIFDNGAFAYIYIFSDGIGELYLDEQFYCRDTESYSCIAAYRLSAPTHEWSCGDTAACGCPRNVDPVCGADGNTYTNRCQAECAGVQILKEGACEEDCLCTEQYEPVCGADGNTYANDCFARCAGVDIVDQGECKIDCNCTQEYDPVCGSDGVTYGNACTAACAGVDVIGDGECSDDNTCNEESGTVFFERCDDGTLFYFIRTDNDEVIDPYFSEGVDFTPEEGQYVEYSFTLADFESPCSIAIRAVTIDCITLIEDAPPADCYNHFGTIVFRDCDDGTPFFFIESDSKLYDVYYADGISFDEQEGQPVRFDFEDANFESPCSFADSAITVTCIEEDIPDDSLLGLGELVKSYIDPDNCETTTVEVFEGERVDLVYIKSNGFGTLIDTDGEFYCADGGAISCLSTFGLEIPYLSLDCSDLGIGTSSSSYNPFDEFSWLNEIIDQQNCGTHTIQVFNNTGAFSYLFVENDDGAILYFEDGSIFCNNTENYSCLEAYDLRTPTDRWICPDLVDGIDGSTFNQEIRVCPGTSVTVNVPKVGLFGNDSNIDPGCPPPPQSGEGLPCPCSLVGSVTVSPEIGVLRFDPEEGILELNPEGQMSYTIEVETIPSNPEVSCIPDRYEMVYTIIPDETLCAGLTDPKGELRLDTAVENYELSITPNPAVDMITIQGIPLEDGTISIYTIVGQQVKQPQQHIARNQVDISSLESGLYVLVWQSEESVISRKFIVE